MIIGLGTDVCEIARVGRYVERYGERFMRRCFTPQEIAYCTRYANGAEQFAARIAAKEAASKALGTGWRNGVHWKCFEVDSLPSGKPFLRIHGRAAELASQMGLKNSTISLTHDAGVALAVVIFEG
ncbi:MAG TPA: holo-ACP synthase [Abditibacteriaceae bacterium]|jgi:holo-[acyl-carrier protein] synthase